MAGGFAGKILWVNLTQGSLREEAAEKYRTWIGGRSLASFLLSQQPELYDPSPAVQPLVIAAGPLVGTAIPVGTRTAVAGRNQISGGFFFSNVGGDFGARLKFAGYDAVVLQGASPKPVYLLIQEAGPCILPADGLWGSRISELRQQLLDRHDAKNLSFIGIGPAGENQAAISCLMVDDGHAAGWGGSGAIFGAKNLKAVVACGQGAVPVFDSRRLLARARQLDWRIDSSEAMSLLVRGGTHGMAGAGGYTGLVPTGVRNLRDEYLPPEEAAEIKESAFKTWERERSGCLGCRINCLHRYAMQSDRFGNVEAEGMHANSVRGLGPNLGLTDREALLAAHALCNDYGLDVDGVSAALAFALECAENGLLEQTQPGGICLAWGDGQSIVRLIEQIGERQGLGELLGRGVYEAARRLGSDSQKYALAVKRVGINDQGIRSHRAWALGIMTSTRGGGHLGGSPQTENRRISRQAGEKLFGLPDAGDPAAYTGKGRLAAWTEGTKAVVDSVGLCYFVFGWYDLSLGGPDELADLYGLATGVQLSGSELHRCGLRCHTLERYLSFKLAGFDRKDDVLPERFYSLPVSGGPYEGAHLDEKLFQAVLDEYYDCLGWDRLTGLPGPQKLKEFGLEFLL